MVSPQPVVYCRAKLQKMWCFRHINWRIKLFWVVFNTCTTIITLRSYYTPYYYTLGETTENHHGLLSPETPFLFLFLQYFIDVIVFGCSIQHLRKFNHCTKHQVHLMRDSFGKQVYSMLSLRRRLAWWVCKSQLVHKGVLKSLYCVFEETCTILDIHTNPSQNNRLKLIKLLSLERNIPTHMTVGVMAISKCGKMSNCPFKECFEVIRVAYHVLSQPSGSYWAQFCVQ